ncbi:MAG: UDP-N-acetylglucosamine 4,6-dehydratase (inverting) [Candidatus Wildermuthbacteria bacterium]|nr:UDP-N-acetylglucosamine 4,6-dehydratase (inverting) [Candidatus Wildermuthbacteria bacterium]
MPPIDLKHKTFLITGGTGSFGQKCTEILLREYEPNAVRIYSRGELLQFEMVQKFNHDERLRFFIGDVRDRERLSRAMEGVDIVVHAAALKQVPAAEYNPLEVIKTNILGSAHVVDAAIDSRVKRAILISTDKAVNPVNLYGATKLCAEKLFVQANSYVGGRETKFSCSRYGNVIGSRGSVAPLFCEQRKNGFLTITDERMTRFWITLEQGVRFVLRCLERMNGGEIFIPKIPSTKITEIADAIAPGMEKKTVGIRPGEKIHEILLTEYEALHAKEFADHFVIEPEFKFWKDNGGGTNGGIPLHEGFRYTSDRNDWYLLRDEIKNLVQEFLI